MVQAQSAARAQQPSLEAEHDWHVGTPMGQASMPGPAQSSTRIVNPASVMRYLYGWGSPPRNNDHCGLCQLNNVTDHATYMCLHCGRKLCVLHCAVNRNIAATTGWQFGTCQHASPPTGVGPRRSCIAAPTADHTSEPPTERRERSRSRRREPRRPGPNSLWARIHGSARLAFTRRLNDAPTPSRTRSHAPGPAQTDVEASMPGPSPDDAVGSQEP